MRMCRLRHIDAPAWTRGVKILIVKLSSLGDVVHTLPVVDDILKAYPDAQIDWVVERSFAPLVQRHEGVRRVIACELRSWRKSWWRAATRAAWKAFRAELQAVAYDAVIDVQGLTKSAVVARCARKAEGGTSFAMAHATDGSAYEAPTRWLADVAIDVPRHVHAITRSRLVCAHALKIDDFDQNLMHFGIKVPVKYAQAAIEKIATIALIHGSSRPDKCWSEAHWVQLGQRLAQQGFQLALVHGSAEEEARSQRLAQGIGAAAQLWPRMDVGALTEKMAGCVGAIGVDSGLSHIAVALDLLHVQMYNFDTAWRTGPLPVAASQSTRQCSVCALPGQREPSVEQVWHAWLRVQVPASNLGASA